MPQFNRPKATIALLLTLGMNAGAMAPWVASITQASPAVAQSTGFSDVSDNYWAADFISALVDRKVIAGFPDGTFQPNAPVTRAQFSAMLRNAFNQAPTRGAINFTDVASNYWAAGAIDEAYEMGFLSGYPGNIFQATQNIPREQVLVALANGLRYNATKPVNELLSNYGDATSISNFARTPIAAATEQEMVVNYPIVSSLRPRQSATRAEVASFIYQALVSQGTVPELASIYIVAPEEETEPVATEFRIPSGSVIPVSYEQEKIILMEEETLPVTLTVASNITTTDDRLLIPANSQVIGELQPSEGGTRFVAQELVFPDGDKKLLEANSQVITETERIRSNSAFWNLTRNAAIGSAAAAGIAGVTGDRTITTQEVLIGTGAGALASLIQRFLGMSHVDVLVVEPETDLALTLDSDLIVSTRQ